MPLRNLISRLYNHLAFTHILRWSLKRNVKRTWGLKCNCDGLSVSRV